MSIWAPHVSNVPCLVYLLWALYPVDTFKAAFAHQVKGFAEGEQDAHQTCHHHEDGEDPLLCGPSDEAVNHIGTGMLRTLHQGGEVIALINVIQEIHEGHIHCHFKNQREDVCPPKSPPLLSGVDVQPLTALAVFEAVLPLAFLTVGHMQHHKERRTGDEDELQRPQTYVGHREEVVVANVMAARLSSVTHKVFLLVTPYLLRSYDEDHDPEKEDYGKPDTAKCGGVLVNPTQKTLKKSPIHGTCERSGYLTWIPLTWKGGEQRDREIKET